MKLMVAVPSNRPWVPGFAQSIMGLMQYMYTRGVNGIKPVHGVFHLQSNASLLPASRQKAVDAAIKEGFDYLFMLDDDIAFPHDVLDRLVKHNLDVVAANYVSKGVEGKPVTVGRESKISSLGKTGVEEVGWIGLGCCLIKVDAIKHIPAPWFEVVWLPETKSYLGEDFMASETLRKHGVKIHIDHDLSNQIGHIGDFLYKEKHLDYFKSVQQV